jgi:hypothetical protein
MGAIKFLAAPIRTIVRFPLFQFVVVVAVILFLQAADDNSVLGQIYYSLDKLVDSHATYWAGSDFFRFSHRVTISRNCELGIDVAQIQLGSNQAVISMS